MRVLLVKTSSLGDLIHTLPALTDAMGALPSVRFDWVVEESFAELPGWHPAVDRVIPLPLRRWRRGAWRAWRQREPHGFVSQLRARRYDLILDAQGLFFKSALVAALARGPRAGYDRASARDPWVSWTYQRRYRVARDLHAIERIRRLCAAALGYAHPGGEPEYGLAFPTPAPAGAPYVILLHGTTWPSKHWPEAHWAALARRAGAAGLEVRLPWHGEAERQRAERILAAAGHGERLPPLGLEGLARQLAGAAGVVGVDTGLAHLAAALGVPAVTLYGPTRTDLTGARGPRQRNLAADFACAPCLARHCAYPGPAPVMPACFGRLPPERVWAALEERMAGTMDPLA